LGKEHANSVRPLGFSFDGPQGKDRLCFVSNDVVCPPVFAEHGLSSQAGVKEMLARLGVWTSQVLVFGRALRELLEAIKRFGPWRFLKSLVFGHFKRRPLCKPKSKPIWCALKKTEPGSHSDCSSLDVDAGHGIPSCLVLAPEAKALVSPVTTSEYSYRSGCSLGYGPVLGVDQRMSPGVLGSSLSMFERNVTGPSSAAEVASGMGSSSEFSFDLVDSSSGTT
jgi:hypothetical protein